jgi:hypothetical protein
MIFLSNVTYKLTGMMTLGESIHFHRQRLGRGQNEMARICGITSAEMSILTNKNRYSIATACKVINGFFKLEQLETARELWGIFLQELIETHQIAPQITEIQEVSKPEYLSIIQNIEGLGEGKWKVIDGLSYLLNRKIESIQ